MNAEVRERCAKLKDPEFHYKCLAADLRDKLAEVNAAYSECLKHGMYGDWYIGPSYTYTVLPDTVKLKRTETISY